MSTQNEHDHDHHDGCRCDIEIQPHEVLPDVDLPAAAGGVAGDRSGRRKAVPHAAVSGNALWLPDVLRAAGLKVAETDGWKTRGHAAMGTIKGVLCHHTATAASAAGNYPSLGIVTRGRPDLSGPLCNLGLGRDGTWYIIAAGLAYHAGPGNWQGVTSGNKQLLGIEAENPGVGSAPWPEVQMEAYARGCAALLSYLGAEPIMAAGHKEFALPKGRKIDPNFDMTAFRLRVASFMNGAAPRPPIPNVDSRDRPTLRRGADQKKFGDLVKVIQAAVSARPDGNFGSGTEAAVRVFQRTHNLLPADGIVGPATWAAIDALK